MSARASNADAEDGDEHADSITPGKPLRVERLLANLGYGKRKECTGMIKRKQLVYAESGQAAKVGEKALASQLLLDGEPLDPAPPLTLLLHKAAGYVVTSPDDERVLDPKVYDLLPHRFGRRRPFLSAVGRLDKDTSGLLLMTDDGQLLHSIQSPVKGIWKRYTAKLAAPLTGKEAAKAIHRFASGQLQLQNDRTPLLPAVVHMVDDLTAEVAICEGRYHQIRRMFAAVGHTVVALHRHTIGALSLLNEHDLELGSWRLATPADIQAVLSGPDTLAQLQQQQHGSDGTVGTSSSSSSHHASSQLQDSEGSSKPSTSSRSVVTGVPDADDDIDFPGEAAAAAKRFRSTSKHARRKSVLLKNVNAMRMQQQQRQLQQEEDGVHG